MTTIKNKTSMEIRHVQHIISMEIRDLFYISMNELISRKMRGTMAKNVLNQSIKLIYEQTFHTINSGQTDLAVIDFARQYDYNV